jgi:hypothetical protein
MNDSGIKYTGYPSKRESKRVRNRSSVDFLFKGTGSGDRIFYKMDDSGSM